MPKALLVPISGPVLKWAIRESGFGVEELASRLQVTPRTIHEWEEETSAPTKTKFARLVEILKRPSGVFFLSAPPASKQQAVSLRKAPGEGEARLNPEESRWLRVAGRLQEAASVILERLGEETRQLPRVSLSADSEDIGARERKRSNVAIEEQTGWTSVFQALRKWRGVLESQGIIVFQLRMGQASCRGFSLWDDRAPLVAINSAYNHQARIFTLFHEYAHLLTRTSSVCVDSRILPKSADGDVERWCERFAASFLVPRSDLLAYLNRLLTRRASPDFRLVSRVATHFRVSLRAAAWRLVEIGLATNDLYTEVDSIAKVREKEKHGFGGSALTRPQRRIEEFGHLLPGVLIEGSRKKIVDTYDVLDYLDVSTRDLTVLQKELVG